MARRHSAPSRIIRSAGCTRTRRCSRDRAGQESGGADQSRDGAPGAALADAIVQAAMRFCGQVARISGGAGEHFVVDVYQAGAGTSHNMNANEVLANRAIEMLGGKRGDYKPVHPNDHVNMAQSTNDIFPTAMRVATLLMIDETLPALEQSGRGLRGEGARVRPHRQVGPHAPAGRHADPSGPGVRRLWADAAPRRRPPARRQRDAAAS